MKIKFYSLAVLTLLGGSINIASAQLPPNNYCPTNPTPGVPVFNQPCGHATRWAYIRNVVTTGGDLNINNSNTNCGNTTTSYSDYTGISGMRVKQDAGESVDVKVTWLGNNTGSSNPNISSAIIKIYIDWNRNGVYDANEWATQPTPPISNPRPDVINTTSVATLTLKVTVPMYAKEGLTRMRIITSSNINATYGASGPCSAVFGEAEDYEFEVVNPCLAPNVISVANLNYKSADVAWTPKLNADFYEYIITPVDTIPHDTVIGFSYTKSTEIEVDTFKCDTKYYVMVRTMCDTVNKRFAKEWNKSAWARDSFTTEPCCYIPNVKVDNVMSTTARASWDPIGTAIGYEYAVTTLPDPPQKGNYTVNTIVGLQGLSPKTTHFVFVRARCVPTPLSDWGKFGFKTNKGLTINQLSGKDFSMDAYPNPVLDQLTVQINGTRGTNARITIISLSGHVVYNAPMTQDKLTIDATKLASGMYIVKYADDTHNEIMRVSK